MSMSGTSASTGETPQTATENSTGQRQKVDVIILGAGVVGVSTALMLAREGLSAAVIDRKRPGDETSHGNAGLIEASSVVPYHFPQGLGVLFKYALNNRADMHYSLGYLPRLASWLWSFRKASAPGPLAESARMLRPLVLSSTQTHAELADMSGNRAWRLIRKEGWVELLQTDREFSEGPKMLADAQREGLEAQLLDQAALERLEPAMKPGSCRGAIHWLDPWTVTDPGELVRVYAETFEATGGIVQRGDASQLARDGEYWTVPVEGGGALVAPRVVICLGPWSAELLRGYGIRLPFEVKRGYHMLYDMPPEAMPRHPLMEREGGYVLAPMDAGLRLTTGIEFAAFNAPANSTQVDRAERRARELFDLGPRKLAEPWLGRRPCLPDMRPIIGAVDEARLPGMFANFGHAHHGLTLGPATGKMLAQMLTGQKPYIDPAPFSIKRFR